APERRAAALEKDDRLAREAPLELVDEARLARPGIADHGDDLRPVAETAAALLELRELGRASDEQRQPAFRGNGHGRGELASPENLVRRNPLALAPDRDRAEGVHLEESPHQPVRRLADQDGPGLGERLEASRQVGGVADRRVVHLEVVADGPHDDRAGVDPDAGPQRDTLLLAEAGERLV